MVAKNVSTMIVMISITLIPMVVMSYGPEAEMEGTAAPRPRPSPDVACPQFRISHLLDPNAAVAGNAVWKGNSTCGQKFNITCIGSVNNLLPCPCKPGTSVVVMIVDGCLTSETCRVTGDETFFLSLQAFNNISYPNPNINVNYERVY